MAEVVSVRVKDIRPKYQNLKEWCSDPDNVYIARRGVVFIEKVRYPEHDSEWANPFKITDLQPREVVIEKYEKYIREKLEANPELRDKLIKLKEKRLGCWCKTKNENIPCHGDVLVKIIHEYCD